MADWSAIRLNCDADISPSIRESLHHKLLSSFTTDPSINHIYYLLHEPGYGGTTLGRRIAWDIHESYPVVVLKYYDNKLINRINSLYKELDNTPFLYSYIICRGDFIIFIRREMEKKKF